MPSMRKTTPRFQNKDLYRRLLTVRAKFDEETFAISQEHDAAFADIYQVSTETEAYRRSRGPEGQRTTLHVRKLYCSLWIFRGVAELILCALSASITELTSVKIVPLFNWLVTTWPSRSHPEGLESIGRAFSNKYPVRQLVGRAMGTLVWTTYIRR